MSIEFTTDRPIKMAELFSGRLASYGISEAVDDKTSEKHRILNHQQRNYVLVDGDIHATEGLCAQVFMAAESACFTSSNPSPQP
jgi:hypothetical protein